MIEEKTCQFYMTGIYMSGEQELLHVLFERENVSKNFEGRKHKWMKTKLEPQYINYEGRNYRWMERKSNAGISR